MDEKELKRISDKVVEKRQAIKG